MNPTLSTEKQAQISMKILTHVANGKTVREAIDAVIGAGTTEKLIGEVYEALRAKAKADTRLDFSQALKAADQFTKVFVNARPVMKRKLIDPKTGRNVIVWVADAVTRHHSDRVHTTKEFTTGDEARAACLAWVGSRKACFEERCYVLRQVWTY